MGQTTPNIGAYIPAAGETNFDAAFSQGMLNIDQHDHSGAPNKGVPITAPGIGPGAITRDKLNSNVVLAGGGLAVDVGSPNALKTDGVLNSIYNTAGNGVLVKTAAATATTRTITGTLPVTVANGDGIAGNPTVGVNYSSPIINSGGNLTLETSPAFLVYFTASPANVTGAGTAYLVAYDTTLYDSAAPANLYDLGTSTFTCTKDGLYQFNACVLFEDVSSDMTRGNLMIYSTAVPGNHECILCRNKPSNLKDDQGRVSFSGSTILKMVAGDTAQVWLTISNGASDAVDILGSTNFTCYFSGSYLK